MNSEISAALISATITVLGGLIFYVAKFAKLEVKVDTMWEFQLRRARIEGEREGVFTVNPHIRLSPRVREALGPMRNQLRQFYREQGQVLAFPDAMLALERTLGSELVDRVCRPLQVSEGSCLMAAIEYAREEEASARG